jgi:flagellar hook-length control protein FliK
VTAGREFRPEEASEITGRILNNTREPTAQVTLPAAEAAADRTILYRDNGPTGEPGVVREIVGNIENRASELPAQTAANASQQPGSSVAGSATAAPITGAVNVTQASQHNPLPTQLESMSLTRNADANEWSSGLSERINWMINQKHNTATIRLDPPALGKLDVQIKIVDDATMITIQTQTAQTRDLIDSASIRLRDFLQESGYQNVNVDVSQRQDQQQARSQTTANMNPEQDDNSGQEQAADHRQQQQASYFSGEGLVDTFA